MSQELGLMVETIYGDIRGISELDNWKSSAQVTKDRLTDADSREEWMYTNNHSLFSVERENGEKEAFLYFGSNDGSIFRAETIDKAFDQLRDRDTGNYYRPPAEDCKRAKETSLRLKILDLELKVDSESNSYGYLVIDTSDFTGENFKTDAQRKFAEAVYGSMAQDGSGESDYSRVMQLLNENGIKTTRIFTLRRETVLKDAEEGDIARACWLCNFGSNSNFVADNYYVNGSNGLRGVRKFGRSDAKKIDDVLQLLKTPRAQRFMAESIDPDAASDLLNALTLCITKAE